jgi:hypothetical protein
MKCCFLELWGALNRNWSTESEPTKRKKKQLWFIWFYKNVVNQLRFTCFITYTNTWRKKKESVEGLQGECTPGTSTQEKRKTKQMQALIRQSCCLELTLKRLISVDASRRGQKEKNWRSGKRKQAKLDKLKWSRTVQGRHFGLKSGNDDCRPRGTNPRLDFSRHSTYQ